MFVQWYSKMISFHQLLISLAYCMLGEELIVNLPDGKIRGHLISNPTENIEMYAWQGIPFATPPLGKLRFQAPKPMTPWVGIKEANQTGDSCLNLVHFPNDPDLKSQSEDCLYINVYAPTTKDKNKFPVLFWIYGGGYVSGSSSYEFYGPDYLINENVIVVTFNYRLELLGFLSTGDDVVLGNAGIKDQLLALKWTKKNIHLFGGDPDQITIFGESAGGISVGLHLWNKKSAGLFRAAICESGCSLTSALRQSDQKRNAYEIAKIIDPSISDSNTTQEVVAFLQSVSASDFLKANSKCTVQTGVSIEADHKDAFITKKDAVRVVSLFESGEFNQVPLIIGVNAEEGLSFTGSLESMKRSGAELDNNPTKLIPLGLNPKTGSNLTQIGNLVKNTYVGSNGSFAKNTAAFLEYFSDQIFGRSSLKQAQLQSQFAPVYLYQFSYYGTVSKMRQYPDIPGVKKVGHADEFPYIFKVASFNLKTDQDFLTRSRLAKMWTNFAKRLNPILNASDPLFNTTWTTVSPDNIQYLDIDETLEMKPNRKTKEFALWNNIYKKYGTPPFSSF